MADIKICSRQEQCPLLLGAVEAKVNAESALRLEREKTASMRRAFNDYFRAGCAMRNAQRVFKANKLEAFRLAAIHATELFDEEERKIRAMTGNGGVKDKEMEK